jgi:hypothetical protein
MKQTFHYSENILWNSLPPNLKLIQDIDLFKKKYTDYLMSKQNNEWLYSLYQGFILDYTQIVIFRHEYVCIVWNCICCIWLLLFWGPQGRSQALKFWTPFFLIWSLLWLWYLYLYIYSARTDHGYRCTGYRMDLCLEVYLWTIYPYFTTFRLTTLILITFVSRSSCPFTYIYIKVRNNCQNTKRESSLRLDILQ